MNAPCRTYLSSIHAVCFAGLVAVLVCALLSFTGCASADPGKLSSPFSYSLLYYEPSPFTSRPSGDRELPPLVRKIPILSGLFLGRVAEADLSETRLNVLRERMAQRAVDWVGVGHLEVGGSRFPMDGGGLVRGVYAAAGAPMRCDRLRGANDVAVLRQHLLHWGYLHHEPTPKLADLVFFGGFFSDGQGGWAYQSDHEVGMVVGLRDDGAVEVVTVRHGKVVRLVMHPEKRRFRRDPETNRIINSYVQRMVKEDVEGLEHLAGELWSGFGTLLKGLPGRLGK